MLTNERIVIPDGCMCFTAIRSQPTDKIVVTFDGLDNFKHYIESHEKDMEDKFVQASKLSTSSTMEFQNFVSNKYGSRGGGAAFDCLSDDFTAY